ncbi:hypothetical protein C8R45DRAFT_986716 [Mycena sanguinolenta]|nr:hypothetical protein C8R45DRAFT_986716 [Mycena sanguinolenta]
MDKEQYDLLIGLATAFLDPLQNLGTAELGEGLEDVFGSSYWEEEEAQPFRTYFSNIQSYERELRDGNPDKIDKPTPPPFSDPDEAAANDDSMIIDSPVQPSKQLSNATLQATTLSLSGERTARLIDNVSPRTNLKQGQKLNEPSARLIIERTTAAGKPVFYVSAVSLPLQTKPQIGCTSTTYQNFPRAHPAGSSEPHSAGSGSVGSHFIQQS